MADRPVRIITKQTAVPGRIPTGTTGNEDNFIRQGEMAQNTFDKKLFGFNGSVVFEYGSNSFLSLTGGTVTGNTSVVGNLSANTLFSGSTNLYNIFSTTDTNDITRVQPGTNTYTGGTVNLPTVNVSALTINTLIVSGSSQLGTTTVASISGGTISGGTLFSGSTNLYSIFALAGSDTNDITRVQPGANIYTGGTANFPTVNISALTISTLVVSGSSQLGTTTATSISGGTISGGTLFSGSTNLYSIFATSSVSDITRVQPGSNITTGGTGNLPIISVVPSPSFSGLFSSGASQLNTITAVSISGGTISGGTLFSGTTNLNSIFQPIGSLSTNANGTNTYTGGTFFSQTINVSALTISTLIASGSSQLDTATATNFSATTSSATTLVHITPFPNGEIYMVGNTTATVIANTNNYYRVSGTTVTGNLTEFDNPISNRLRYTGATTLTFYVNCNCSLLSANANRTLRAVIVKNGTGTTLVGGILANTEHSIFPTNNSTISNTYAGGIVTLSNNDYLELYVRNVSAANNITVDSMNFVIKQI